MARRSRRHTMSTAASVSPPAAKSMRMAKFTSVTLSLTR